MDMGQRSLMVMHCDCGLWAVGSGGGGAEVRKASFPPTLPAKSFAMQDTWHLAVLESRRFGFSVLETTSTALSALLLAPLP